MYDKRTQAGCAVCSSRCPARCVDDFAAELGYPSGRHAAQLDQADQARPRQVQYRSKPVLPKLQRAMGLAVGRGATAAGWPGNRADPSRCATAWEGTPEGARRRLLPGARGEGGRRGRGRGKIPPGRPAGPPDALRAAAGAAGGAAVTRRSRRSSPTWSSATPRSGGVGRPKAGSASPRNAEATGCASEARGAFGAARPRLRTAAGTARSTYYYQLDALTSRPPAPPDRTAGEVEPGLPRRRQLVEELPVRARGRVAPARPAGVGRWCGGSCARLRLRVCYARRGIRKTLRHGEIETRPRQPAAEGGRHPRLLRRAPQRGVGQRRDRVPACPTTAAKCTCRPSSTCSTTSPSGWSPSAPAPTRASPSRPSEMACATLGEGGARRAPTTRLLPLARVEGHMQAPRAGQVDVALGHQPDNAACEGSSATLKNGTSSSTGGTGRDGRRRPSWSCWTGGWPPTRPSV